MASSVSVYSHQIPNINESRSLRIWVRAAIAAPISLLLHNFPNGFELVKILLEKLWQDCLVSHHKVG